MPTMTETRRPWVGKRIRALRKAMGLTQAELGSRIGATVTTVARWELDMHEPMPIFSTRLDELEATVFNSSNQTVSNGGQVDGVD